jgi:hypothetical protein
MEGIIALVVLVIAIASIVGYFRLYGAIFILRDHAVKHTEHLKNHDEMMMHQNGILIAQMQLLSRLAEKPVCRPKKLMKSLKNLAMNRKSYPARVFFWDCFGLFVSASCWAMPTV